MTTQTMFTPGPYLIAEDGKFVYTLNAYGFNRVWFHVTGGHVDNGYPTTDEETWAVASLAASAPDLYAALEVIVRDYDHRREKQGYHLGRSTEAMVSAARAALRRARGEA